ncbi:MULTISPECIES: PIN domain-containing protein [Mesorhizobium]|uniref:PIN domain-containing protein n=1 Tax=Mesorhizobium denitrificans TaxID=2294114 RepID=A0A371XE27_9HYPH|nr:MULTISPECIES: PIN domain-containing protein [Mesorhizobium]RFC67495.1 PIN domain-containing protein [Mesorhizobium denitrificans]
MPAVKVFVDTNVILYSHDRKDPEKMLRSREWLRQLAIFQQAVLNLQVLNEVTNVLLSKKWLATVEQVFSVVGQFSSMGNYPLSIWEMEEARTLHLKYHYSWWDCLLLASALNLGCTHFLSEDLQDEQKIEGLTIVSPFAHTPEQILVSR